MIPNMAELYANAAINLPLIQERMEKLDREQKMDKIILDTFDEEIIVNMYSLFTNFKDINDSDHRKIIDRIFELSSTVIKRNDGRAQIALTEHLIKKPFYNDTGLYLYRKFREVDLMTEGDVASLIKGMIKEGNVEALNIIRCEALKGLGKIN